MCGNVYGQELKTGETGCERFFQFGFKGMADTAVRGAEEEHDRRLCADGVADFGKAGHAVMVAQRAGREDSQPLPSGPFLQRGYGAGPVRWPGLTPADTAHESAGAAQ